MTAGALSRITVTRYAAAVGPVAILGLPLSVLMPPFVTDGGLIAVGMVGLLFMLTTIWDGVIDPAIGSMVDRNTAHPAPHRRWMWWSGAPILLTLLCIVMLGDQLSFWPLLLLVVLFTSSYSLFDVAHLAWGSALARDRQESSRLFGAREWASKLFLLLAFAAPAAAQAFIPDMGNDGRLMAYAALALLFVPLALWMTLVLPARPIVPAPGLGWREEWKTTLRFPALTKLILVQLLNAFGLGAITSLFVFFADGVLDLDSAGPLLLLISFIGAAITTPLWTRLSIRWGKPRGMIAMNLWLVAVLLFALVLPMGNFAIAALFVFAIGSGFVGLLFIYGMAADLTAEDQRRCGRDRTGFIFAIVNLCQKVGTAVAIGISYALLDWFGFDSNDAAASETLIRILYVAIPSAAWCGVAATLFFLARDPAIHRTQVAHN